MGPITLFDKSFLQSLTVDESVWFDNFFPTNVCPLFYIETLADLEKKGRKGRKPEQEVRIIADKFPEMRGLPNAFHLDIGKGNLLGQTIPMTGRIVVPQARILLSGRTPSTFFGQSPEAEAFQRWQSSEFRQIERQFARTWRNAIRTLDLREVAANFPGIGVDHQSCETLEQAKTLSQNVFSAGGKQAVDFIRLALLFFDLPEQLYDPILQRWANAGYPPLSRYAPYAAHVLTVEVFFHTALATKLISAGRSSNKVDMAYLFYLPFCRIFVSSDRLHQRCAPLFLRYDQDFVWGGELKEALRALNTHYGRLPEETKERGVMGFAAEPPEDGDFFVSKLWDRHVPGWRDPQDLSGVDNAMVLSKAMELIREATNPVSFRPASVALDPNKTDEFLIQRGIKRKKGSWWQVAKNLKLPKTK